MPAKLVVWIDGRWRSLKELEKEGRDLKFIVLRNGELNVLPRPPKASNIRAGAPLPYRIVKKKTKRSKSTTTNNGAGGPISTDIVKQQPFAELSRNDKNDPVENAKACKSFPQITVSNQNILKDINDSNTTKKYIAETKNLMISDNLEDTEIIQRNLKNDSAPKNGVYKADNCKTSADLDKENIHKNVKNQQVQQYPLTKKGSQILSKSQISDKLQNMDSSTESESSEQEQHPKVLKVPEVEIADEIMEVIERFLSKSFVFKVNMNRFNKDDDYKLAILYKLQPFVKMVQLQPRLHHRLSPSLRSSKRTCLKKKSTGGKISKPAGGPPVKRKLSVPPGREYSSLEDHAIVSWLSASRDRECAVNGNRIWRELEAQHARLTGQDRTWHSLRNRYLRYILPGLGLLALSPSHVQRLRAAAATGEIKKRTKPSRPSILHEPPVVRTAHRRANVKPSIIQSDSDTDDGLLHQMVKRPSLKPKKSWTRINKPQADKSRQETENRESGKVQLRKVRGSPSNLNFFKRPEKSATEKDNETDDVKASKVVCGTGKEKGSTSPLKGKHKSESEHSDLDEGLSMPKKRPPKARNSEDSVSDFAPCELSRLRPRHFDMSRTSDDGKPYTPISPLKRKRRRLFNPVA